MKQHDENKCLVALSQESKDRRKHSAESIG